MLGVNIGALRSRVAVLEIEQLVLVLVMQCADGEIKAARAAQQFGVPFTLPQCLSPL